MTQVTGYIKDLHCIGYRYSDPPALSLNLDAKNYKAES